jgi:DNA sulfur modification protein DndC
VVTVTPTLDESFWVCLIGKGYPSPNRWFRWCTERLKINPTSRYIKEAVGKHGSAIIVLGTRKAESANRAAAMNNHSNGGRLREHDLPGAFVYAPIADLSNNEVWAYLLQSPNPWGKSNRELLNLYGGACKGGECPFVIETGTQSCGKSRFGCWVCTVVDKDQAMESYVNNGHAHLKPLLDFRDRLYNIRQQSHQKLPPRINRKAKFGPFLIRTRENLYGGLMAMQKELGIPLLTEAELKKIPELIDSERVDYRKGAIMKRKYCLTNGRRFTVISDYDIAMTPRARMGPWNLRGARLLHAKVVESLTDITRVVYYEAKR